MSAPGERESSAFFANNDASSYNTRYLKSIRNKERFQELHFYKCTVELIDELFPKQSEKGTMNPPAPYRASAVALAQWRELDQQDQINVLEKERLTQGEEAKAEATSSELKRNLEAEGGEAALGAAPAAKLMKTEDGTDTIPDRWDPSLHDLDIDFCKNRICRGVTLDFLKRTFPNETHKLGGFASLVGDAMQFKAQAYKNNHSWPFASDPGVAGAIVEQIPTEDEKSAILLKWVCVQLAEGETCSNRNRLDSVHFHRPTCTRASPSLLCDNCKMHDMDLVNLCGGSLSQEPRLPN